MEPEVLGTPSIMTSEFLGHFREENLITLEGEYEKDYVLEAPSLSERVCYLNHERGSSWMSMFLITKATRSYCFPFTNLRQIEAALSQLHPDSWAMIQGFKIICEYLGVLLFPQRLFPPFTLTCSTNSGLTTG